MFKEEYSRWLEKVSVADRAELEGIEIADIEDRFYTSLDFGTAGMRGIIGMGTNRMNVYTVAQATAGLADLICEAGSDAMERGVTISYDSRRNSELFAVTSARVLVARGVKVQLFDYMHPVPMLSYAIRKLNAFAGIMITASHNPPQYNGYKVYGEDGAQMSPENAKRVVTARGNHDYFNVPMLDMESAVASGQITMIGKDMDVAYYEEIKKLSICPEYIQKVPDFKIVYTPLHGTGYRPVCDIMSRLGVKNLILVEEQLQPDPNFSTVAVPNPEQREAFTLAIEKARANNADAIIATDPDADRMGLAVRDSEGEFRILSGNQIGCLLLYYILSKKKEAGILGNNAFAVKTIVSTELARAIACDFGVELIDVLTGFKFIGEKILELEENGDKKFVFGFEESYGYLAGSYARDKDAVAATMLITEMAAYCASKGQTLFDALEEIYAKYGYYIENTGSVCFEGKEGMDKMKAIMASIRGQKLDEIGGEKVLFTRDFLQKVIISSEGQEELVGFPASDCLHYTLEGNNWACIRPSGTEPKIKVYAAACGKTKEEASKKLAAIKDSMHSLLK